MLRYSWIVFVHAILLSFESIAVEFFQNSLNFSVLAITTISIPTSGTILLAIYFVPCKNKRNMFDIFKHSKQLFPASILLSIGILTWYDSVSRIGASKDGLIAGTLEIVLVLFLSHILLKERLTPAQLLGVSLAILGFFITISIGSNTESLTISHFTFGDFEAIVSAICFACSYLFTAKLVKKTSPIKTTGFILILSGMSIFIILSIGSVTLQNSVNLDITLSIENFAILFLFSFIPLSSVLFYNIGMKRIGASLTSVLASSTIILTILFQVLLFMIGYDLILPLNIPLAVLGGSIGIIGIFIIHLPPKLLLVKSKKYHTLPSISFNKS